MPKQNTLTKARTAAEEARNAARHSLAEAEAALKRALHDQSELDAELDGAPDLDAADLGARITANATQVESLRRLVERRREAAEQADASARDAGVAVLRAEVVAEAEALGAYDWQAARQAAHDKLQTVVDEYLVGVRKMADRHKALRNDVSELARLGVPARSNGREVVVDSVTYPITLPEADRWEAEKVAEGLTDSVAEARIAAELAAQRAADAEAQRQRNAELAAERERLLSIPEVRAQIAAEERAEAEKLAATLAAANAQTLAANTRANQIRTQTDRYASTVSHL